MGIENIQSFVGLVRYIGSQDRNQDGQIQRRELEPGSPLANPDEFRRADSDESGALSPGELMWAANHYQQRDIFDREVVEDLLNDGDFSHYDTLLRSPATLQGKSFPTGTHLYWDQNGRIYSAEIPRWAEIQNIRFRPGTVLLFDNNGRLESAELNGGRIQGFNFPPGTNVTFDVEGRLTSAVIPDGEVATRRGEYFTGRIIIEEDQTVRSVPLVYIGRGSYLPSGI